MVKKKPVAAIAEVEKQADVETKVEPQESKAKPKDKSAAKRPNSPSKRYQSNSKRIENRPYPLDEALELAKELATAKFDETIEVHLSLGIDPTQSAQQVRGSIKLPHGTGRAVRVLVFAEGSSAQQAVKAGASLADEKVTSAIEKGSVPFDLVLATPEQMPKIAKLAKVLGVRGLMPNPKTGTITPDPAQAISERVGGLVDFRTTSSPTLHLGIGKASLKTDLLKENLTAFYQAVLAARPGKISGEYVRSVSLSSTMGPSIKIDPESLTS